MKSLALLVLRVTYGSLLASHGGQKLFGWFGGGGVRGTSHMMDSLGLQPAQQWAMLAGISEFGGGVLTALGFLSPMGPLLTVGSMGTATTKVHWGKPIWVSSGGAELPVTNMAIATTLMLAGPGKLSVDGLLGTKLPAWMVVPGLALVGAGVYVGLSPEMREQLRQQLMTQLGMGSSLPPEQPANTPRTTGPELSPTR